MISEFYSLNANLFRKSVRANSHGNREDGRHSNGDSPNEQHQEVVDASSILPVLDRVHYNNFNHYSDCNADYTKISNSGQHLQYEQYQG